MASSELTCLLSLKRQQSLGNLASPAGFEGAAPDVTLGAKELAEQWILMAKSETLEMLGEEQAALDLAEALLREHMR